MRIAVIGAGPAGISAALAARKAGADFVTLFSREPVLPYNRPQLAEIAFKDGDTAAAAANPTEWYGQNGITLRLDTPVTSLDAENRIVQTPDGDEVFDAFVIAGGANPLKPIIPGIMASPSIYTLWSADDARKLFRHTQRGRVIAIIGGGLLGIEAALCAAKAKKEVVLIEKSSRLLSQWLDVDASAAVAKFLESSGVTVKTNLTVASAQQIASKLCLKFNGEAKSLDVDMVVLTVGTKANLSLAQSAGLAVDRGICVDETLQTSEANIFAAGDCAQLQSGMASHSCVEYAVAQGQVAGYNAVAAVNGSEPTFYSHSDAPLHFSSNGLEIHAWGQTSERSINSKITKITTPKIAGAVRLKVVRPDGVVAGVQMVGTDVGFNESMKAR